MSMTMAAYCVARGEARGLRKALVGIIERRLGSVPPAVSAALDAADAETLDCWLQLGLDGLPLDELGIPGRAID